MAVNLVPRRERFTPIWLLLMSYGVWSVCSMEGRLLVNRTLVRGAKAKGAVCLDGSLPAYHLHRGFGSGAFNWLLQFEGGGWCNDINSCLERAKTRRGSTRYMNKFEAFSGILSSNASLNHGEIPWVIRDSLVLDVLGCSKCSDFILPCFFPQYALPYITTPYFILNSAYDVYQFHHSLVPLSADQHGQWRHCELDPAACTPNQISILQDRKDTVIGKSDGVHHFPLKHSTLS
ncbi:hypothetical protein MRB53_032429 [Persea americana]|uniref:Uncharacterized protein n=1 Tax=Persea americana TaxID=3435 RepID=A0ACC2KRT3_PERAE|nr:hypothetical protein MRB53_032429 [Persea americana]